LSSPSSSPSSSVAPTPSPRPHTPLPPLPLPPPCTAGRQVPAPASASAVRSPIAPPVRWQQLDVVLRVPSRRRRPPSSPVAPPRGVATARCRPHLTCAITSTCASSAGFRLVSRVLPSAAARAHPSAAIAPFSPHNHAATAPQRQGPAPAPPYKQHANTTCKHTQTQKQPGAQHTSTSWRLSCGAKVTASRGQVHGRSQSSSAKISQPVWCTSRMATVVRFPRFAVKSAAPSPVPDTRTRSHPRPRTASQTCVPFHHPPRRPAHAALATCRCCALGHRCYSPLPAAARRRCCCCYDVPS